MKISGIAERLSDAYNRHDPSAVERLYLADGTDEDVAQRRPRTGPAPRRSARLGRFFGWFPDVHWLPQIRVCRSDELVAVTYLFTATRLAQLGLAAALGQVISLRGVHVLELQDGMMKHNGTCGDAAAFQHQLNDN